MALREELNLQMAADQTFWWLSAVLICWFMTNQPGLNLTTVRDEDASRLAVSEAQSGPCSDVDLRQLHHSCVRCSHKLYWPENNERNEAKVAGQAGKMLGKVKTLD